MINTCLTALKTSHESQGTFPHLSGWCFLCRHAEDLAKHPSEHSSQQRGLNCLHGGRWHNDMRSEPSLSSFRAFWLLDWQLYIKGAWRSASCLEIDRYDLLMNWFCHVISAKDVAAKTCIKIEQCPRWLSGACETSTAAIAATGHWSLASSGSCSGELGRDCVQGDSPHKKS